MQVLVLSSSPSALIELSTEDKVDESLLVSLQFGESIEHAEDSEVKDDERT